MFKVKQFGKNFHKAQQNSSRQPGRSVSVGTSHICEIQSLKRCRQISSVNIYYSLALEKSFCSGLRNFFIFVFIGCFWSVQSFMRSMHLFCCVSPLRITSENFSIIASPLHYTSAARRVCLFMIRHTGVEHIHPTPTHIPRPPRRFISHRIRIFLTAHR